MMPDPLEAFGLMPIAISTRISAQSQRPLAIVVSAGALAILVLRRVLQPVLIATGACAWPPQVPQCRFGSSLRQRTRVPYSSQLNCLATLTTPYV